MPKLAYFYSNLLCLYDGLLFIFFELVYSFLSLTTTPQIIGPQTKSAACADTDARLRLVDGAIRCDHAATHVDRGRSSWF